QFVLLSHRGFWITEAAFLLGVARTTGQRILDRFHEAGVAALRNPSRPGRPPRCDAKATEWLQALLSKSPRDHGYHTNTWTCALLAEALQQHQEVTLKPEGVRSLLHRLEVRQ